MGGFWNYYRGGRFLGIPYAHVLNGSALKRTFYGVTHGHAIRRAQRFIDQQTD